MGGGSIKIFRRKFFVSQCQKFRRGEYFTVAIIWGIEKVWIRGGGGYQDFPSKLFCLTVPKSFVGEPFSVSLISGTEKVWIREGWREYQDFPAKVFSHSAENYRRGIVYSCKNFGYRKNLDERRGEEYQDFPSETFCLTVPKFSVGESFTVAITSGIEKVWIRGGGKSIKILRRKVFVSQCRKIP